MYHVTFHTPTDSKELLNWDGSKFVVAQADNPGNGESYIVQRGYMGIVLPYWFSALELLVYCNICIYKTNTQCACSSYVTLAPIFPC